MMWWIYNVLFFFGFALLLPRYLWRMRRRGGYRRDFGQRLGWYRPDVRDRLAEGHRVWIHCVSVGEAFVALALAEELRSRRSGLRFVFSTATSTGYALLNQRLDDPDVAVYWPIDLPPVMARVLRLMRPAALVLVEAELWPNILRMLHARGVPVFLFNGRISHRSHRGYRRLRCYTRRILPMFEALCVQSREDRDRLADLGAPPERIHVMNSAKYRLDLPNAEREAAARAVLESVGWGDGRALLLGGSTWPGEEAVLLDVLQDLRPEVPGLGLVLAPRHVERCPDLAEEIRARGWRVVRRTEVDRFDRDDAAPPDVFLLDTTGELKYFYRAVDVVFMGKSLCAEGGQNIIEPAQSGRAILVGPHMENFPVILDDFRAADAIRVVPDAGALRAEVRRLLGDPRQSRRLGDNAARLVREKAGAVPESAALILSSLEAK